MIENIEYKIDLLEFLLNVKYGFFPEFNYLPNIDESIKEINLEINWIIHKNNNKELIKEYESILERFSVQVQDICLGLTQ